jgi:hypothetical protein
METTGHWGKDAHKVYTSLRRQENVTSVYTMSELLVYGAFLCRLNNESKLHFPTISIKNQSWHLLATISPNYTSSLNKGLGEQKNKNKMYLSCCQAAPELASRPSLLLGWIPRNRGWPLECADQMFAFVARQ